MLNLKKSFTLIELLIVIAILGTLTFISIPAFRRFQSSLQLSGAVRELITDLRYTEQLAVTEQISHGILFSFLTNGYQIIRWGEVREVLREKNLPEKVSFQEITGFTNDEVVFNPYGAVKESGIITLINTQNTFTTIEVRPSGFVKISK